MWCDIICKQHCQNNEGEPVDFGEGVCQFQEFSFHWYPFRFSISKIDLDKFVNFISSNRNKIPFGDIISNICNNSFILGIIYYCFNLKIGIHYNQGENISIFKLTPTFITRIKGLSSSKKAVTNCCINILGRIYIGQYLLDNSNINVNLLNIIIVNYKDINYNKPDLDNLKTILNNDMEKYILDEQLII